MFASKRLVLLLWIGTLSLCNASQNRHLKKNVDGLSLDRVVSMRGGWSWRQPLGHRDAAQQYRETLEEQVLLLGRQLRTAREEATQLRKLLKVAGETNRKATVNDIKVAKMNQTTLKKQLATLREQITQLEKFQAELQKLLEEEKEKTKELERKLATESDKAVAFQKKYQAEIAQLETTLVAKTKKQLQELENLMERRVKEAAETARTKALQELEKQVASVEKKVQSKADQKLQNERRKAAEAVERERIKMRKLVKALAEREKKLFAKHEENERKQDPSNTLPSQRVSPKSTFARKPVKNIRSPL